VGATGTAEADPGRGRIQAHEAVELVRASGGQADGAGIGNTDEPATLEEGPGHRRPDGAREMVPALAPVETRPQEGSALAAEPLDIDAEVLQPTLAVASELSASGFDEALGEQAFREAHPERAGQMVIAGSCPRGRI
jgi:hypothetical protein